MLRWFVVCDREWNASQMHAERAGMKTGIHEKTRHEMRRYGLAVDGGNQHSLMTAAAHPLLSTRTHKMSQSTRRLRPLRLVGRQKDENIGIVATKPRDQLAVAQNHFSLVSARENAWCRF